MDYSIIDSTAPILSAITFQHQQQSKPWSYLHYTGRKSPYHTRCPLAACINNRNNLTDALRPPTLPEGTASPVTSIRLHHQQEQPHWCPPATCITSRPTSILFGQINMVGCDGVNDHHKWEGVVPPKCNPSSSIPRLNAQFHWESSREPLHVDIDTKKACGVGPRMSFANAVRKCMRWWGWYHARCAALPSKSGHMDSPCMRTW